MEDKSMSEVGVVKTMTGAKWENVALEDGRTTVSLYTDRYGSRSMTIHTKNSEGVEHFTMLHMNDDDMQKDRVSANWYSMPEKDKDESKD
jgi:hypothetical protein